MKGIPLSLAETRGSKKNLIDQVLLAGWIALYSVLLLGFGILKWFEGVAQKRKAPTGLTGKTS